ncbi:P-loop NTPase fold protein, partial [Phaeobacter italicus]
MRLTVPEPKIDLYNDGFADHDQLDRKATGDKLSDLVERIDDPMVIALDGAWGSGKSFFLKCWVGEHLKR